MVKINNFIFDDVTIELDYRKLLKDTFGSSETYDAIGKEINLVGMDFDLKKKVDMPAVTISVYQDRAINQDDMELQAYVPFTVEVNVYTSGNNKVLKNKQLCNIIIKTLQTNNKMKNYYNRGLRLEENREVGSLLDSSYRRILRMSGLCDNNLKLLLSRR